MVFMVVYILVSIPASAIIDIYGIRIAVGIGTVLTGPALDSIKAGKPYYGEAPVLGTPYVTGYEPIKDTSGAIIGAYFVGYKK